MGLIFFCCSVPFGLPQYVQCILHGLTVSSFVSHSFWLTAKSVYLVVEYLASLNNGENFIVATLVCTIPKNLTIAPGWYIYFLIFRPDMNGITCNLFLLIF